MGSPRTEPDHSTYGEEQREVSFTHDLLISQFETTQAEWEAAGLTNQSRPDRPDTVSDCLDKRCPVGNMTWFDIWTYANLLNDREGLPHCAEPPPWGLRAGARSLTGLRNYESSGGGFRLVRSLPNAVDAGAADASRDE